MLNRPLLKEYYIDLALPPRIHVMALSELVKARNSVDPEWGAGLFPETSYHCQNMSFNLFSPCPAPFFLWKSRTFFFIISVFSGLCGTLSLNAKMNAVVKESLCFCYVFGFGQYTGVVAIWMWLLLHLLTKKEKKIKHKLRYIKDEVEYVWCWLPQWHCCHYTVAFAAKRGKTHFRVKSTIQRQRCLPARRSVCVCEKWLFVRTR